MNNTDVMLAHTQIFTDSYIGVYNEHWLELIDSTCTIINAYCEQHGVQFNALQVKVKWGQLRFYWTMSPNDETTHEHWDFFSAIIEHLEGACYERAK